MVVSAKVKAIFLASVVVMVLPEVALYAVCRVVPPVQPVQEVTVNAPALVIFQVLDVPEISFPVPALEIVKTSPVAAALD